MPTADKTIATRQLTELLFSTDEPLTAGAVFSSPVRLVAGYRAVLEKLV